MESILGILKLIQDKFYEKKFWSKFHFGPLSWRKHATGRSGYQEALERKFSANSPGQTKQSDISEINLKDDFFNISGANITFNQMKIK